MARERVYPIRLSDYEWHCFGVAADAVGETRAAFIRNAAKNRAALLSMTGGVVLPMAAPVALIDGEDDTHGE